MSFLRSGSRPRERSFDLLSFKPAPPPSPPRDPRSTRDSSRRESTRLDSTRGYFRPVIHSDVQFSFLCSFRDPRKSLMPSTFDHVKPRQALLVSSSTWVQEPESAYEIHFQKYQGKFNKSQDNHLSDRVSVLHGSCIQGKCKAL